MVYQTNGEGDFYTYVHQIFSQPSTEWVHVRYRFDFESDELKIYVDGVEQTLTIDHGDFSDMNPSDWAGALDLYLGTANNGGAFDNPSQIQISKFLITDLVSDEEASIIYDGFDANEAL